MGNVPQPNIIWRGAHPNNFTTGRPGGGLDGRETFHHTAATAESAVIVFNNPTRYGSSHFVVTDQPGVIFQCVSIDDTAWCDGNWESNLRTISVEHHGDWRFGYDNPTVRENSALLVAWLRENYGVNRAVRHRDVIDRSAYPGGTVCPADLPVESIWNRSDEIINQYNQPPAPVDNRPEWLKNRSEVPGKMVYSQREGIFVHDLNSPGNPKDDRRFALNQNFEIKGQTSAGGQEYWITKSSYDATIPSGLLKSDVADAPYVAPTPVPVEPPKPVTPDWADSLLVDEQNREMYVLRATPLIDLENGRPVMKDGKEQWFSAGDIVKDISALTIVSSITYQLTEYSFQQIQGKRYANASGIKSSDLTIDPKACPPGTPANPELPTEPSPSLPDVPIITGPVIPPVIIPMPTPTNQNPTTPAANQQTALARFITFMLAPLTKLTLLLLTRRMNRQDGKKDVQA